MTGTRARASALALALLVPLGCQRCDAPGDGAARPAPSGTSASELERTPAQRTLSLIDALPTCDVDHRGPAVDLGTSMLLGRLGWSPTVPDALSSVEHGGATWSTVRERDLQIDLFLLEASPVFVSARIRSKTAKNVTVSLDGSVLGTLRLVPGEARTVTSATTTLPVDPGRHRVALRFSPGSKDDEYADVDWVRLGKPDDIVATFGAPTLTDLVDPVTSIGNVPRRSLALRPPASIRCAVRVPPQGRVRAAVGMLGEGRAEAEIRVLVDGSEPTSLLRREIVGGVDAVWTEVEASLDAFAGQLVMVELGAPAGATTGRLAFGEPEVVSPAPASALVPKARGVLVIVLAGVEASDFAPWSGATDSPLEAFADLSRRGVTYLRHRAPSTLDRANLATLLTGLPPESHGLADDASRLPAPVTTLLETARESQVRTALFTGVPVSFAPFGLQQGAAETVEMSPVSGDDSTAAVRAAASWLVRALTEEPRRPAIVVAHARGGHPPWTPSAKQLEALAPSDYAGNLQPRRAAQQIAEIRARRNPEVAEPDRVRLRALHTLAVSQHDAALAEAVRLLESAQLLDETLVVVTGDSSSSVEQLFAPDLPLSERALTVPLWILFPDARLAGVTVRAPSEFTDVGATLFGALGLAKPAPLRGGDLFSLAAGRTFADDHPQVATMANQFAARWGDLVLHGTFGKPPALCHLDLDPTCAFDRRAILPLASTATFRAMVEELQRRPRAPRREAVELDETTRSALAVWGR